METRPGSKLVALFVIFVLLFVGGASAISAQSPEPPSPPQVAPFEVGEGEGQIGSRAVGLTGLSLQATGAGSPSNVVSPFDFDLAAPSERPAISKGIGVLSSTPPGGIGGIAAGANWLLAQQAASGLWPWTPGSGTTTNTNGPSAMGMLMAYLHDGDERYLSSAVATGNALVAAYPRTFTDGDPRFATYDPWFLELLSIVTGDSSYANFVQQFLWDKLAAGTYGEGNDMDALEFGMSIVAARASQGIVELAAWDVAGLVAAADLAGEMAIRDAFMAAVLAGLEQTTVAGGYDTIGLAGGVWASAISGVNLDPEAGVYSTAESTGDLVASLLEMTLDASTGVAYWDGAFLASSTLDATVLGNADAQTSAYALLALWAHDATSHLRISHGAAFLRSLQDSSSGQFLLWPGAPINATGSVEVNAEVLTALTTVAPDQVWVDDDWVGTEWGEDADGTGGPGLAFGYDQFSQAQLGIDGVGQSEVHVAPGLYEEQLEVMKDNLELIGDGSSPTEVVIRSPMSLPLYFTTSANNFPVIFIHGAENVRLENLTVDGDGRGVGNYRFVGVAYVNSSGVVDNCRIIDVREEPASGAQHGVGLMTYNGDGAPRDFSINGTLISGHQKNGMVLTGSGLTVHVTSNEVYGVGHISYIAQNGLQVSGGATGELIGNIVESHWYSGPSWASSCILPYNPGPNLVVDSNQLDDCQAAVYGIGMSGPGILSNEVANSDWGIINSAGTDVEMNDNSVVDTSYGLYAGDGTGNSFGGNRVMGGEIGLSMDGSEHEPFVLNNIFVYQAQDAMLFEPYEAASPSGVEVNLNAMCGFAAFGVENTTANETFATFNYWGHQPPVVAGTDYTGTVDVRYPIPLSLTGPSSVAIGQTAVYTASLSTPYGLGVSGYDIELQATTGTMVQPNGLTISPTGVVTATWTAPTTNGSAIISAMPECGEEVTQTVQVQSGIPTTISITVPISGSQVCLNKGNTVTFEVTDAGGNPVPGHWVGAYFSNGSIGATGGGVLSAQAISKTAELLTKDVKDRFAEIGVTAPIGGSCQTDETGTCSLLWTPDELGGAWILATGGGEGLIVESQVTVVACGGIYLPIIMRNHQ